MATMKTKAVSFNIDKVTDKQIFDYCARMKNFSAYVKSLIAQDATRRAQQQKTGPNGTGGNVTAATAKTQ